MVYVGMDVHRKRTQVAVINEKGEEVSNRNFPNDPGELAPMLMALESGTAVAFEAAYGWGWLAELLDDLGLETHLAHAKGCKAIASARLKNDKVDARTLAHLLRADLLPEAWLAPREVRDLRMLLRHRARLVRYGTSLKTRIHAVLADQGVRITVPKLWNGPGRRWLANVQLAPTQRAVVDDLLALLDATSEPIARLERDPRSRETGSPCEGPPAASWRRLSHGDDARRGDRRHRTVCDGSQAVRVGWAHAPGPQLRSLGASRPHNQAGINVGAVGARRGRAVGQVPTAVLTDLCPDRAAPRQEHRHGRGVSQASCAHLPHPQGGEPGTEIFGEGLRAG